MCRRASTMREASRSSPWTMVCSDTGNAAVSLQSPQPTCAMKPPLKPDASRICRALSSSDPVAAGRDAPRKQPANRRQTQADRRPVA